MCLMQPKPYVVELTPLPTAARVSRQRSAMRMRIVTTVISLVVLLVLVTQLGARIPATVLWSMAGIWGVSTVVWLSLSGMALSRAKRDLASIGHGVALHIDGQGIEFFHPEPVAANWSEISSLRLEGRNFGAGPRLSMEVDGSTVASIPISFLDATASAIDGAARARSGGRVGVDTSAMDRML